MKIAFLSPRKSGLSETFIQAQIDRLEGNMSHYYGGDNPTHRDNLPLVIEISFIARLIHKVKYQLGLTRLSYPEFLFKASLRKQNPDVVLAQYGVMAAKNLNVIKSLNIPLIVHFHGYDASVYHVLENQREEYQAMFSYSSAIVVVSKKMMEMLKEIGAPVSKLHHVCYGPNPAFNSVIRKPSPKTFLAVGRFVDKKAPHLTLMAFQRVLHKHPDAQLRFVGGGPLYRVCSEVVSHNNLMSNVQFLGIHGMDLIIQEMHSALAFVQHSRRAENGDMEGTPVAILEAQLAGLPVISTVHAGIPDVVIQGVTGMLSEENDVKAMSENMLKLLDDTELAIRMGEAAKAHIQANFSMDKYIQQLQQIVNQSTLKK